VAIRACGDEYSSIRSPNGRQSSVYAARPRCRYRRRRRSLSGGPSPCQETPEAVGILVLETLATWRAEGLDAERLYKVATIAMHFDAYNLPEFKCMPRAAGRGEHWNPHARPGSCTRISSSRGCSSTSAAASSWHARRWNDSSSCSSSSRTRDSWSIGCINSPCRFTGSFASPGRQTTRGPASDTFRYACSRG
jgi:hypothetical protein